MAALSKEQVEKALEVARPELVKHGGNVKLLGVSPDNVVLVKLTGACSGCAHASSTLHNVIEKALKEQLPELNRVEAMM
jgi:Fe-S cluster biogenesis protein NfuA